MDFLKVTPRELSTTTCLGKTKIYGLIKVGHLSPTVKWCGSRKVVFDLKVALTEIARLNKLESPCDESIGQIWAKILEQRTQADSK